MQDQVELQAMFLADHAEAVEGKLYVTGGCWDRLSAPQVPVVHPHLSLAISMRVPARWTSTPRQMLVRLLDPGGDDLLGGGIASQLQVTQPEGRTWVPILLVLNFNSLELRRPGRHEFVLSLDGVELGRTGFDLATASRRPTAD